ncbi:MAG: class B sortase [Clostridia bacterium]|nr:class B sortase [Clostridia bacterium]
MAEDNNRQGISRIDDESITEIDLGNFLSNSEEHKQAIVNDIDHNINKTEKSLEDELNSLYEDIMNNNPIKVPVAAPAEEEKPQNGLESMWMSPDEYMEMPSVPAERENPEMVSENSPVINDAKNDIFNMIESLKSETEKEQGFSEILSDIESNKGIEMADTDLAKTDSLTADTAPAPIPEAPSPIPAAPAPVSAAPVTPAVKAEGIDTDSAEFDAELKELLGEPTPPKAEPVYVDTPASQPIYVDTPVSEPVYVDTPPSQPVNTDNLAATTPEPVIVNSLTHNERTIGVVPDVIEEDNGKITRKEKKQAKLEAKALNGSKKKSGNASEVVRKLVLAVAILVIIGSSGYLAYSYLWEPQKFKSDVDDIQQLVDVKHDDSIVDAGDGNYPEGMKKKYMQLYDINPDLKGWISIPGLQIDLPVVQGKDDDYYLHKNFYQQKTMYGVPFFDHRIESFKPGELPTNMVIYGHNMRHDDLIFGLLENYRDIETYQQNPVIECNTIYGDYKWFVVGVFMSNAAPAQDNGYVFPYNFVNLSTTDFEGYIKELELRRFYSTGVDLQPTDKILTLSTCCYDFTGARLVVVARLMRDGESPTPDTSKAVANPNPKYPQAWYDANKKTNPYTGDSVWNPAK